MFPGLVASTRHKQQNNPGAVPPGQAESTDGMGTSTGIGMGTGLGNENSARPAVMLFEARETK